VRRVLALLRPQQHETFIDYGCGDGRWLIEAARTYGCRAVGVEIDPAQAERARRAVAAAGLGDRIEIIEGDATRVSVRADVGVAYLYPDLLQRLKPALTGLRAFATYMHPVEGVSMRQHGDSWVWTRPAPVMAQQPRVAWYGGQAYSGRVCGNPRCSMCAAIARQLGQ
jgi:23S rRNA G2445 N2-methylase RlmL